MKYGFTVELQSQTNDGDNADETWMFIDGAESWGRFEMGDQDGAADRMFVAGEDSMPGRGGYDGAVGDVFNFSGNSAFNGPGFDTTSDATKIIYFSPRFSGLQLGASYTPDTGQKGGGGINDLGGDRENTVSLGANYEMSTDDLGVTIGAGLEFGGHERTANSTYDDDWSRWGFGAKLAFAGFEVSSGFAAESDVGVWRLETLFPNEEDREALTAAGVDPGYAVADGDAWWANIGLRYTTGPWKVGGGYFYSETDHDGLEAETRRINREYGDVLRPLGALLNESGDTTIKIFSVGANYNVAPGFDIATDINFVDEDTDVLFQNDDSDPDNDGTVFVLSTIMSF